jgi:Domain of unknown function (DUF3471)
VMRPLIWPVLAGLCVLSLTALAADEAVPPRSGLAVEIRRADQARQREAANIDPSVLDAYVGDYQLGPTMFIRVTHTGRRLYATATGSTPLEMLPESERKFFSNAARTQIVFTRGGQDEVKGLLFCSNGRELPARRVDPFEAGRQEAAIADHRRSQAAMPGSEAALRRHIEALGQGRIELANLTDALAGKISPHDAQEVAELGTLKTIAFDGVGAEGWDVYDAQFSHGIATWHIHLDADGRIDGLVFHPGP